VPKLLNAVLGTKFKIISGYPASNEAMAAMEKGEVDGSGSSWAAVKIGKKTWLAEKKIKIILQDVPERAPDLPDVPCLGELGTTPEQKQMLGLYASGGAIGRSFLAPPGMSEPVAKALRDGFAAMVKDPEMIAEMQKIRLDLEPADHVALEKSVAGVLSTPPEVVAKVKAIFGN
jgi:tripartite-type tricarboxylate transporter receptor subunit TctC